MEGSGEKEIFIKGVGNDQKEEEGRGWDNKDSSCFSIQPPQTQKAYESL